eukprot:gene15333-49187_t
MSGWIDIKELDIILKQVYQEWRRGGPGQRVTASRFAAASGGPELVAALEAVRRGFRGRLGRRLARCAGVMQRLPTHHLCDVAMHDENERAGVAAMRALRRACTSWYAKFASVKQAALEAGALDRDDERSIGPWDDTETGVPPDWAARHAVIGSDAAALIVSALQANGKLPRGLPRPTLRDDPAPVVVPPHPEQRYEASSRRSPFGYGILHVRWGGEYNERDHRGDDSDTGESWEGYYPDHARRPDDGLLKEAVRALAAIYRALPLPDTLPHCVVGALMSIGSGQAARDASLDDYIQEDALSVVRHLIGTRHARTVVDAVTHSQLQLLARSLYPDGRNRHPRWPRRLGSSNYSPIQRRYGSEDVRGNEVISSVLWFLLIFADIGGAPFASRAADAGALDGVASILTLCTQKKWAGKPGVVPLLSRASFLALQLGSVMLGEWCALGRPDIVATSGRVRFEVQFLTECEMHTYKQGVGVGWATPEWE